MFSDPAFIQSLKHLGILAVVYIVGALFFGMLWALLLEKGVHGEGVFRTVYLFPMAVSMFASGVVWNWLLNSDTARAPQGSTSCSTWWASAF